MDYFDDILNVYAYLKSKQQSSLINLEHTVKQYQKLDKGSNEMEERLDDALSRARKLANLLGIEADTQSPKPVKASSEDIPSIFDRIKLPEHFNVDQEFAKLAAEAKAAGFTNVQPEELLTSDEIAHALAYEAQLDEEYIKTTRLQKKDLAIMFVAVVLQVLRFYISSFLNRNVASSPDMNSQGHSVQTSLGKAGEYAKSAAAVSSTVTLVTGEQNIKGNFKSAASILRDPIPYLHRELPYEAKDSKILGQDKYLGWIFGVSNILTDSMTLYPINSYKVAGMEHGSSGVTFSKISTIKDVLMPIVQYHGTDTDQRSLLAAMLRQGSVLSASDWSDKEPMEWLEQTLQIIRQVDKIKKYSNRLKKVSSYLAQAGFAGFIDTIIIALHSALYDPATDGEGRLYAMRTNKIIVYSGAIAAGCNSIPAIAAQDLTKLDLGGLLTTILHFAGTMRFRINVKAEFLTSKYLQEINKELEEMNAFFE